MVQKKFTSSLRRQSNETRLSTTKFVLVNQEPLLYLQLNKPNKQNVSEINLKMTVDTAIDVRNEASQHHFLKSVKSTTHNTKHQ